MLNHSRIHDCVCGLRYTRSVIDLDVTESASAYCTCGALLGEWSGMQRLVFDAEDPLLPAAVE
ncbi:MAG: hypothetical protein NT015_10430 [Alphaproteobacteria bacterium]|nr:hypothetical protein [Alphaproteobacteria bacterium]